MYGVLWKYLFIFGFILWVLLCIQDHYRTLKQKNESYNNNLEENFNQNFKKSPPCLTFWKTLSMVLSLGALVYIKRTSNVRKNVQPNIVMPFEQNEKNLHKFTINSYNPGLKQTEIGPDIYPEAKMGQKNKLPAICGVEMVQKKLELLEQSVQNLKKRHYGSSVSSLTGNSPGIVSGSPQFRNFLLKLSPTDSSDDLKVSSNHLLVSNDDNTAVTANTVDGDDIIDDTTDDTPPTANNFDDTYEEIIEKSFNTDENANSNINTQDSSWCTISEKISDISDPKVGMPDGSNQVLTTPITEILQARQNFCDMSKTSIEEKSINSLNSIISFINNDKYDYDENSIVPGSNLVPSEKSSISSRSISSHQQLGYFPSFSSLEDDDVLLNTLD